MNFYVRAIKTKAYNIFMCIIFLCGADNDDVYTKILYPCRHLASLAGPGHAPMNTHKGRYNPCLAWPSWARAGLQYI